MEFTFEKRVAKVFIEKIAGRMRQVGNDLPESKMLSIDEFVERMTFCVLHELGDINYPIDTTQLIIMASLAMNHACLQLLACEGNETTKPSITLPREMVN